MGAILGKALPIELGQSLGASSVSPVTVQTPSDIFPVAQRAAWYRSDLGITQAAGRVSAWTNIWGNGDLAQATGASQPQFNSATLGGQNCVSCDDGNRFMTATLTTPVAAGSLPFVWGYVRMIATIANTRTLFNFAAAAGAAPLAGVRTVSATGARYATNLNDGNGHLVQVNTGLAQDTSGHLIMSGFTLTPSQVYFSVSGSAASLLTSALTSTVGTITQANLFHTGSGVAQTLIMTELAEFGLLRSFPTTAQRQALIQYCTSRYGTP